MQIDQHLLRENPSMGYMKGKRNVINRVTNPQERQARTDQPRNTASSDFRT